MSAASPASSPAFDHQQRAEQLANEFLTAQRAVLRRLHALSEEAATTTPEDGGWNAAQIGWHVAKVNQALRLTMAGKGSPLAEPPLDFIETWEDKQRPPKIQAPEAFLPPDDVTLAQAIAAVEKASEATAETILGLTPEQARQVTDLRFGTLSVYQVAEFARMHTERHLGQLDRVLGPA